MDSNIKDLHGQMVANYAFFLPYIKGEANSYFAFPTQAGTSSFTHSLTLSAFALSRSISVLLPSGQCYAVLAPQPQSLLFSPATDAVALLFLPLSRRFIVVSDSGF